MNYRLYYEFAAAKRYMSNSVLFFALAKIADMILGPVNTSLIVAVVPEKAPIKA
jgi:hypothetical protein